MALKKFIGARYAPAFAGAWSNTKQYAALSVVYADNRSYVSRKTVPAGTAITNTEFWIQSSDWNAQVAEYNLKVEGYNTNVEKYNKNVQDYSAAVSGFYADTLHSFDTKADMQADRTLALGETLLTCGDKKIGDGGGSFYQVVDKTSVTAVALDNGLFAEPFEFQPYDYSQFQQEVEGYKNSTTRVYNVQKDMTLDIGIKAGNVLMTTGALTPGDGQGSFWNVSNDQSEGAIPLENGKYAKRFNLTSVDVSGNLLFNNKGNQVAIWGIKAGGEAVNIPVSYNLGETRTVYVAVEYTPDNTNATVNLVASGPTSFTKSFAWSDASVTSGQVKTVMYAITLHSTGNSVYTGSQTVTSYLTTLTKFIETVTVNLPNASTANAPWSGPTTKRAGFTATVNTALVINNLSFTTKTAGHYIDMAAQVATNGIAFTTLQTESLTPNTDKKVTFNRPIVVSPNRGFNVMIADPSSQMPSPSEVSGNYGAITVSSGGKFAGSIEYYPVEESYATSSTSSPSTEWPTADSVFSINFSVNKRVILKSLTLNTKFIASNSAAIGTISLKQGDELYAQHRDSGVTTDISGEAEFYTVLEPGDYTLKFDAINGSYTRLANTYTENVGPFTFNNTYYQGTIAYQIL